MTIELISFKNTDPEQINLKLCKTESRGSSYVIPLKMKNNQPILLKTPKLYMPFLPKFQTKSSGYIRLSFDNFKIDQDIQLFYAFFLKLEEYIKIIFPHKIKKTKFRSCIRQSLPYADYFNVSFDLNQLKIYNLNFEQINIHDVQSKFYAYFVIQLNGIYFNSNTNTYGLIWDLIQFKLDNPKNAIQECLFLDEIKQSSRPLKEIPELKQYFKMLTLGIPKNAVKQKMIMAKMDPDYLEYNDYNDLPEILQQKITENSIKNCNQLGNDEDTEFKSNLSKLFSKNSSQSLINNDILKNKLNKLKKIDLEINDSDSSFNKIKKHINFPVPSLFEIKDALKNLKSLENSSKLSDY